MKYQQDLDIAWREVDGEAVLVDPQARQLRVLNPSGSFLWAQMEKPRSLDDLAGALVKEFAVDPVTARADAEAFVRSLMERKLLKEVPH